MSTNKKTKAKGRKARPAVMTNLRGETLDHLEELKGLLESRVGVTLTVAQVVAAALKNELARAKNGTED